MLDGYQLGNLILQVSIAVGSYAALPQSIYVIANDYGITAARIILVVIPLPEMIGYGLTYGVFCREDAVFISLARRHPYGQPSTARSTSRSVVVGAVGSAARSTSALSGTSVVPACVYMSRSAAMCQCCYSPAPSERSHR